MDHYILFAISTATALIVALVGIVYKNLTSKIAHLESSSNKELLLKVDTSEYKVIREWEKEAIGDMKITIKELKDENNAQHQAIMLEIKKVNQK